MRIISGKYKGRIISPPKNFKARPTTDRARESLFNILANTHYFEELRVLDLFAGTGSIGFEFVSRGAAYVEMLEKNYSHFQHLQKAKHALEMENIRIIKGDFFRYIKKPHESFNLIFADPPYDMENFKSVPEILLKAEILSKDGIFIMEHPKSFDFRSLKGFTEQRNYGGVNFSFFSL